MANRTSSDEALDLVHQGWDHLRQQRPLAARASWRLALARSPGHQAATEALRALAHADDLPAAARKDWRLRSAIEGPTRQRWGTRLDQAASDLEGAAEAFADLAHDGPDDLAARFNEGLCLAWLGRAREALARLDQYVRRAATIEPELACDAWTLAVVLRAGAGAEDLADDLSHSLSVPLAPGDDPIDPSWHLRPAPRGPEGPDPGPQVWEWLDRPMPPPRAGLRVREVPRVLAVLVLAPRHLRLSSPDPAALAEARERLGDARGPVDRTASPLPLRLLDAGLWTFRLPLGLDEEDRARLVREALEYRLEHDWVHWPRHGLDGRTPLRASQDAAAGDPVARVQLEGVLQLREQLAQRPGAAALQGAYPFDRLRRRLGLPPRQTDAIDPADLTCLPLADLAALDPAACDEFQLAEAAHSASGLRDDAVTARLTAAWLDRGPPPRADRETDLGPAVAALVRHAVAQGQPATALRRLDQAAHADPENQAEYQRWANELAARSGWPSLDA